MQAIIDITLPADQLEGTAAKVSHWLIDSGATVEEGEPILELETDKVTMEVCAPASGRLTEISKYPGDDVEPETVLGKLTALDAIDESAEESAPALNVPGAIDPFHTTAQTAAAEQTSTVENPVEENSARHLIGPAVRRLLRENNLDIAQIQGSGRDGRVTRDDVMDFLKNPPPVQTPPQPTPAQHAPSTLESKEIPHTPMRKAIAKHMVESLLHTSPHVTSVFEMDMSNIIEHRRWHKKEFAEEGVNLTFTAYFLAATVKAMLAVPQMNARYHEHALELFEDINIGVGTALGDDGLVVPVVEKVQHKKLFGIAQALQAQTEKARTGKLTPADMKNGTFTISNHGVSGSLFAAPIIINQPQVAILGIGKLEKRVVVREVDGKDVMEIKPMCYVSLSIDHRAVDAYQTNRFLSVFVETIENWGH